ncbi:MAG: nucleoside-diphosphate kinase [Rubricoccaceae bacterium]
MLMERTLAIIKPDAVAAGHAGKIIDRILAEGFAIRAMKLVHLTPRQAEGFYAVHAERPFFGELTQFMASGPCIPLVLEREDAVARWREVIGATNPEQAAEGTLRKQFARSMGENAVHGSDSPENGVKEGRYFFSESEIVSGGADVIDA